MNMARHRKPVNVTLDPVLVALLDEWCGEQDFPPTRAQAMDKALEEFLEKRGKAKPDE